MITDAQLLELNRRGLIPGPQESEAAFLERADYCLSLQSSLRGELCSEIPFAAELPASYNLLESALVKTRDYFDIQPGWIPVFFSNYRLAPWHGGCAWIFQLTEKAPLGALLQLQKTFRSASSYLGIYQRDDLIVHECAHIGRMAFNEPKFEEFFAYSTESSKFRRWFGPIVQSARESMLFILTLIMALIVDLSILWTGLYEYYSITVCVKAIPISLLIFAIFRLWRRHSQYAACALTLTSLLGGDSFKVRAVLYRLTDKEITEFSGMATKDLLKYIRASRDHSLRWRLIAKAYFEPD